MNELSLDRRMPRCLYRSGCVNQRPDDYHEQTATACNGAAKNLLKIISQVTLWWGKTLRTMAQWGHGKGSRPASRSLQARNQSSRRGAAKLPPLPSSNRTGGFPASGLPENSQREACTGLPRSVRNCSPSEADAGEAVMQIAAGEKGRHGSLDDWPPEAILGLKPLVVDLLEGLEMPVHQAPQVGGLRIAWTVQGQRLDTRRRHDRKSTEPVMVYVPSLEQMYTSRQAGAAPMLVTAGAPAGYVAQGTPGRGSPALFSSMPCSLTSGSSSTNPGPQLLGRLQEPLAVRLAIEPERGSGTGRLGRQAS